MSDVSASAGSFKEQAPVERALDILGVYILPLLCLSVDYIMGIGDFFFRSDYPVYLPALWIFAASGIAAFAFAGRPISSPALSSFLRGALLVFGVGALAIGIALLPIYMVFFPFVFLSLIAPLGLVPFLTGFRLIRRARRLASSSHATLPVQILLGTAAVIASSGLVLLLSFLLDHIGENKRLADLVSGDRKHVLWALSRDTIYSPRDVIRHPLRLDWHICRNLQKMPLQDDEIRQAIQKRLPITDQSQIENFCAKRRSSPSIAHPPLPP